MRRAIIRTTVSSAQEGSISYPNVMFGCKVGAFDGSFCYVISPQVLTGNGGGKS